MSASDLPHGDDYLTEVKSHVRISERVENMTRAQLLDIVAQPHVVEDEWVAACHELERRGELVSTSAKAPVRGKKVAVGATIAAALLVLATASFGLFRYFSAQPTATPVAPPVASAVDVDFGPYMTTVQKRIKLCWFPPVGAESTRVKVAFKVFRDGRMDKLRLLDPSSDAKANEAALAAIRRTAFDPLPGGAPKDVDIEFTFDYNVFSKDQPGQADSPSYEPQP